MFRKPSNLVTLQVKKEHGAKEISARGLGEGIMIRPSEHFDHGLSNSQGSQMHYFNI